MQPDEIMALITITLVLAYGLSQAYTWLRTNDLTWLFNAPHARPSQEPPAAPRSTRATKPRAYTRRKQIDYINERKWIEAGLSIGLDPAWLAAQLKGNPLYNRRRINGVARMVQHATN
jgi:hypothetical protein